MRILLLGGGGQVGTAFQALPLPPGVTVSAPTRAELDVTDEAAVDRIVAEGGWGAVVNASAYTAVDKAETEVGAAWRLNALAPAYLAAATAKAGIPFVHVSTDYVFDGSGEGARQPNEPVRPLGIYGASKAAGEMAVRTANPRHAILRTAWVVSPHRANFVKTMLRLAGERDRLTVVADQTGSPTSAADLAAALLAVARRLADGSGPSGTFHCVNAGGTTWHGFASAIMAGLAARGGRAVPVDPIPTSAFPTPARRPANSTLSTDTLREAYGLTMRPWPDAVDDILDQLIGPAARASGAATS